MEMCIRDSGDTMQVVAPRYREDIEIGEPDLAEEVIREYGYDHITPTFLKAAHTHAVAQDVSGNAGVQVLSLIHIFWAACACSAVL